MKEDVNPEVFPLFIFFILQTIGSSISGYIYRQLDKVTFVH